MSFRTVLQAVFFLAAGWLVTVPAPACAAEDEFYKGKQLHIIVPVPPGGIYDLFARLVAENMPKYLPGNPSAVVQNMAGAGGLQAANYMNSVAAKDGTVISSSHSGTPTAPLLSPDAAKFDVTKFGWLGSITKDPFVVYAWHTSPIHSMDSLKTTPFIVGGSTVGSASIDYAIIARDFFDINLKIVTGYTGSADVKIALERGELHGTFGNGYSDLKSAQPTWLSEGKVRIILQHGLAKHPDLPNVPLFIDYAKTAEDRQALEMLLGRQEFSKAYFAPPGLPPERLAMLRKAFDATIQDKAFLAGAQKAGLPVDGPMTGQQVAVLIERIAATPPSVVKRVNDAFDKFKGAAAK
jgi:tripartite-type tricarboxylate transporter receptor subunit TctC